MRKRKPAIPKPFRSMLEFNISRFLLCPYEETTIEYVKTHTYTPDFSLAHNVFLEVKGLFKASDRGKHIVFKKQHPEITIIFAFQDPHRKITKSSKTSYADWAEKHGFQWVSCEQEDLLKLTKKYRS